MSYDDFVVALSNGLQEESVIGEGATVAAVGALATLVDSRDDATYEHSGRVAKLAEEIALALGLSEELARAVYLAGKLHDVGKVAVPDAILRKHEELSEEEWAMMRRHPSIGANVVSHVGSLAALAPVIRSHHERYDGEGYPQGLCGEEIPLEARIVAVADSFDAMLSARPYQEPMSVERAREKIREGAGTQFDPEVVATLDRLLDALAEAIAVG